MFAPSRQILIILCLFRVPGVTSCAVLRIEARQSRCVSKIDEHVHAITNSLSTCLCCRYQISDITDSLLFTKEPAS